MAQRVKADVAKVGIVIDLDFMTDDAINNRIYAAGKTKDLYAPDYDAFLWDWDVSGTTPTPIMEVLLSNNASSDSFYASKAYDKALIGARTASSETETVAAVRKAEADRARRPAVSPARAPERRRAPPHRHLARLAALARRRPAGRCSRRRSRSWPSRRAARRRPPRAAPAASATVEPDEGWLTTPRSVLIGSVLISLAILGTSFIGSGRRRTEPLEWTEE